MIKRAADRLLQWFCRKDYYLDISGDLEELYSRNAKENSARQAELNYLGDVLLLLRLSLIQKLGQNNIIYTAMLKNYFRTSYRNLLNHKLFSAINVVGLAIGLSAFLLMDEYIRFERSYDGFFSNAENIYRLTTDQITPSGEIGVRDAMSFHPSGPSLYDEFPEVTNYTTTFKFYYPLEFRQNGRSRFEKKIIAADSNFFELFDYRWLEGNPKTALKEPYSLVITEAKAFSYFGAENPIGQKLEIRGDINQTFIVRGVIENVPENTHYKFNMVMSLPSIKDRLENDGWNGYNYYTFLELQENTDIAAMDKKLVVIIKKYIEDDEISLRFNLQPVTDIHLHSNQTYEPELHGSAQSVDFLVIIATFVLTMAWVNYINLSTARALDRAKEVGLRKVIGAHKRQLIIQFMFDAFFVNLLGAVLAIILSEMSLNFFNNLIEKEISKYLWDEAFFLTRMTVFFAFGTVVSGFYPALVLSGFHPTAVLKGKLRNSSSGIRLRKGLVVLQFMISFVLIAGTFTVIQQVEYMRSIDIGIDVDQVVDFSSPFVIDEEQETRNKKLESMLSELQSQHVIKAVSSISSLPGGSGTEVGSTSGGVTIEGLTDRIGGTVYRQSVDDRTISNLDMKIIAGRNFNRKLASDTASIIVNESFLKMIGMENQAVVLERKLRFGTREDAPRWKIVGVMKDFHRTTLKQAVEPTIYFFEETCGWGLVKLDRSNMNEGLTSIKNAWQEFFPGIPPEEIVFLDQRFEKLYAEDRRFGQVFGVFSILALIVSILGLLGLASFMAVQRTKEVGVRKALGASLVQIIMLFCKEFSILLGLSAVAGFPVLYFVMSRWLDGYANRIGFPWWLAIISLVLISVFAFLTIGLQTRKVALTNPAKTLKYE